MTSDTGIRYELVGEMPAGEGEAPLHLVHRTLRGRWRLVGAVAVGFALLGGVAGFLAKPQRYRSTGLVRIDTGNPLRTHDRRSPDDAAEVEAFITAQESELQSRRVLDMAVETTAARAAGWPGGRRGVARLQPLLEVSRGRREPVLHVSVTDSDPERARAAVNSVLSVYLARARDPVAREISRSERALGSRQDALLEAIRQLREQILDESDRYGAEAIDRMYTEKVNELMTIDRRMSNLQIARERLDGDQPLPDLIAAQTALLRASPRPLARLSERQLALIAEIESLGVKYGPNHAMIRELRRRLDAVNIQMELLTGEKTRVVVPRSQGASGAKLLSQVSREQLDRLQQAEQLARSTARREAARLEQQRHALTELNDQVAELRDRLRQTRRRLDEIRVDAARSDADRIAIAAYGDLPVAPISDRRAVLAVAGAMFGGLVGCGLVFIVGLLDPRLRNLGELERIADDVPVLGALPRLDAADARSAASAAHGVRQLRSALELAARDAATTVLAVAGCNRGTGKTSVAVALATAYAAAGGRTLLIDADIGRPGLTSALGLTRAHGLRQALETGAGGEFVHRVADALDAMPAGDSRSGHLDALSRTNLARLLETLRERFDVIVLDAGPVVSSVEARLVATSADHVLLVVDRGESRQRVRAAIEQLRRAGATLTGLVFNRGAASEFDPGDAMSTTGAVLAPLADATVRHRTSDDGDDDAGTLVFPAQVPAPGVAEPPRRNAA